MPGKAIDGRLADDPTRAQARLKSRAKQAQHDTEPSDGHALELNYVDGPYRLAALFAGAFTLFE
jgi:hypothetical protein